MNNRVLRAMALMLVAGLGWSQLTSAPVLGAQPPAEARDSARHNTFDSFNSFAVAADHPLASLAGAEILKAGGNAVDAAVATSFALSVVRPFSCGIGGGGFMVIHLPDGDGKQKAPVVTCINYREMCPAAVGPKYFEKSDDPDASTRGGKACAVPGTVAGLLYALDHYGTMPRDRVLAPAIRLAREGFQADEAYRKAAASLAEKFDKQPEWKQRFAFAWDRLLGGGKVQVGQVIKLPEQAAVLEAIAEKGLDGFYKGAVAESLVKAVRDSGGDMTAADLSGFKVLEAAPLRVKFDGREMLTMPPPSSGGLAMAEVFGVLERAHIQEQVRTGNWALYTQYIVETFKHAFADRAHYLGDPAFTNVPSERLLAAANLDRLARGLGAFKAKGPDFYGSALQLPKDGGTSHFCVIDSRGGAVACTETINLTFGSLVSSEKLGFCLNNEMDDFTTRIGKANAFELQQSERNLPAPGKRPLSSMSPTIVLGKDGKVEAIAGASGGPRIITATTQVLLNALERGEDAGKSVARPRVHHQWKPNTLEIEKDFNELHEGLAVDMWMRKLGQHVETAKDGAAVQLILKRDGKWQAACDPRKGGSPAGE